MRFAVIALLGLSLPVSAWSSEPAAQATPVKPDIAAQSELNGSLSLSPSSSLSRWESDELNTHAEIAPNARLGFGIFGLKSERSRQAPVTVREIDIPKTRRAGVGLSIRF